jgi:hypothetical protein
MRTSFLLLSVALLLVACDDKAETTGPRSRSIVAPAADVTAAQAADWPPGPSASLKPSSGFTTITVVESAPFNFAGVGNLLVGSISELSRRRAQPTKVIGGVEVGGTDLSISRLRQRPQPTVAGDGRETGLFRRTTKVTAICVQCDFAVGTSDAGHAPLPPANHHSHDPRTDSTRARRGSLSPTRTPSRRFSTPTCSRSMLRGAALHRCGNDVSVRSSRKRSLSLSRR